MLNIFKHKSRNVTVVSQPLTNILVYPRNLTDLVVPADGDINRGLSPHTTMSAVTLRRVRRGRRT